MVIENTAEGEQLTLIEIWGDTYQDTSDLSNIQHVGELYVNEEGNPILNEGKEQYKIEVESYNKNLFNTTLTQGRWNSNGIENRYTNGVCAKKIIKVQPSTTYQFSSNNGYRSVCMFRKDKSFVSYKALGTINKRFKTTEDTYYIGISLDNCTDITTPVQLEKGEVATDYTPHESNQLTIFLPCQLMKVGEVSDKLYWDNSKGRYVIEKNIGKLLFTNTFNNFTNYDTAEIKGYKSSPYTTFLDDINGYGFCDKLKVMEYNKGIAATNIDTPALCIRSAGVYVKQLVSVCANKNELNEWIKKCYYIGILAIPELIETNITEQKTLNCYSDRTYITISNSNTNLFPIIKAKCPINSNTSNQISLPRENNFDSILNITLEPNNNTNITFFEGGLDLEITNGIEIQDDGGEFNSGRPNQYASNNFIDLISYTTATFTIDTLDIPIQDMKIYYYNQDQRYIDKFNVAFESGKFHKSRIKYPNSTKYCKVAFSLTNESVEYSKIRILRDKTKEHGFKTITKIFNNDKNYTESFSELVSIKDDIERLVVYSNNYPSINNFDIINNFDKTQKTYSCKIPKPLEPGETLSYTKVGKKQFLYKTDSTPYNSITNVSYKRPYKEYDNIVDNIKFTLFKNLQDNNGNFVHTSDPYCATEKYANVADYQGKTITLSVASLMTKCAIVFYGQEQGFIKKVAVDKNFVSATVPNNACYMRFACYLNTLAAQTPETQDLIQKHVMVTLSNIRCDYVPYRVKHSCTVIPEENNINSYKLNTNIGARYLFVQPYQFQYEMNSIDITAPYDGK